MAALKEIIFAHLEGLEHLTEEKFRFVEMRFVRRDHEIELAIAERKDVVRDALVTVRADITGREESLKQAATKSESSFTKQIDQLTDLFRTAINGQSEQLSDIKGRVLLIEGRTMGITSAQSMQHATQQVAQGTTGNILTLVGVVLATLLSLTALALTLVHKVP